MLKEVCSYELHNALITAVLILILMEHAQRVVVISMKDAYSPVLILILMEHAQRVCHRVIGVKDNGGS